MFALHDHQRISDAVKHNDIAPSLHIVHSESHFHAHARLWVPAICCQKVNDLLPDPFLWREGDILFPHDIENLSFAVGLACLKLVYPK